MRIIIAITLVFAIAACVSVGNRSSSLESKLPNEPLVDRLRFFHGSDVRPRSIYAFHISENDVFIARPDGLTYTVSFDDCPELKRGLNSLKIATTASLIIAAGLAEPNISNEIVMDGPTYELVFYSRQISGLIELKSDGNARNASEWIDAALSIRQIEESCSDS